MPRYTFRCRECTEEKEIVVPSTERDNAPECHGKMKRIYNGHTVIRVPRPRERSAGSSGPRRKFS